MINNKHDPPHLNKKDLQRGMIVAMGVFGLFALLVVQFFKLQITQGEKWTSKAKNLHEIVISEPFQRGTFYSNASVKKGHPSSPEQLVFDVPKFHLYIDPDSIPVNQRDTISEKLKTITNISKESWPHFRKQFDYHSRSRRLARWLNRDTKQEILDWWKPYARQHEIASNAIYFIGDYQRSYPFGKLLGQALHTIRGSKEEVTKQGIPTGGLEYYFNDYLKGSLGKRRLLRSLRNPMAKGELISPPQNGADIFLTINHYLQAIAEEELSAGIKQAKAAGGWAVMMDPYNGHILALAQYPFFNPANYKKYYNSPELIDHTTCKASTIAFEPGSTMKPLTLAVALKANEVLEREQRPLLFNPEEKINTRQGVFSGRSRPLRDGRVHNFLNMYLALQKSSNIYMATLAERIVTTMGSTWYRQQLADIFSLGKPTDIELPAESSGLLPTPGKKYSNGVDQWSQATPYSLAIGHNLQVNSFQILKAYSVFANGGYSIDPTIVRKIVSTDKDGHQHLLLDHTKRDYHNYPRVINSEIVRQIVTAMKYVTKLGGTSIQADLRGYTEAGKTGTSEKIINGRYSDKKYISSFVGFTPVDKPQFVLLVVVDEPLRVYIPGVGKNWHGGTCAAPIFRRIADRALDYLGITPDDPHGYPRGDPRHDPEQADWILEARQLRKLYQEWND
ncbi:MAG: peptidoglycan D,D-transpeptidase FtsI family protein [Chlamydiota bacterium]